MKKKKKKRKLKNVAFVFLALMVLGIVVFSLSLIKVRGYYVLGNNYLDEESILKECKLDNSSSYLFTQTFLVNRKCKNNKLIKEVNVDHTNTLEIKVTITEYKILFKEGKYSVIETGKKIEDNNDNAPVLINEVENKEVYANFIKKMNKVDNEILSIISEIKYDPNDVDDERFLITMNDGNMVYITLSKITKVNSYPSIIKTVENRKGILYLDYGNYFVPIE